MPAAVTMDGVDEYVGMHAMGQCNCMAFVVKYRGAWDLRSSP